MARPVLLPLLLLAAPHLAAHALPLDGPKNCDLAIVGAGPGGVYTAWRLAVDTKTVAAASICIFERAERVGGRTFSVYNQGPKKDLTVELGAYRFCGSPNATNCAGCEMCMPMMNNLIKGKLGLHTAPYQPGFGPDDEHCLVKVVDAEGQNHGLARYVEKMANESKAAGVRFFIGHEATAVHVPPPGATNASFTVDIRCTPAGFPVSPATPDSCVSPGAVAAKKVLLNTPLLPTLRIVRNSPSLKAHFDGGKFPVFLRVPHGWRHIKLYVHYDWAWWRTLGHTSGDFHFYGPTPGDGGKWDGLPGCRSPQGPLEMCSSDTLPLEGRYHDGHVRCDDGNATGNHCRGFMEATYTSDGVHASNVTFFEYYQSNTDPPFVHVNRNSSADGEELLNQVHERLITYHMDELKAAGLYDKALAGRPTNALLSMWDPKSPGFGAGTHGMNNAMIPGGPYAAGGPAGTVPAKSIKPFKSLALFIANEAFHPADWGEGSLEMAENIVHKFFGAPPPNWIAPTVYSHIMFGPPDGPSKPPGPAPAPGPPPPPPPPPGKCPPQTKLNASTICLHSTDVMGCKATLACPTAGTHFVHVDFADIGTPKGTCGHYTIDPSCTGSPGEAASVVAKLCLGKASCQVGPNTAVLNPSNPSICDGVVKSNSIQLSCGKGAPVPPPPAPPTPPPSPPPSPGPAPSTNSSCAGPFGDDLPALLKDRPSGTKVPDWFVMAAPFTPFYANGSVNAEAVLPLAKLFKERLGITAVWVMGMRGQFDAMTVAQRKEVASAWVAAGKITGLFTMIQCGSSSVGEAAEVAAYVESIGGDAIGSVGPFEELCSDTECVVDWVAPVAAAAPKTPFFYYHTPGWNGKSINGVKMYDWFKYAETKIPTAVGVKFESYSDSEFKQTCDIYGDKKVMIYAPCNSLGHFEQGTPGRGAFIQAFLGPMCRRIKAAYDKSYFAGMKAAVAGMSACKNAGGNFVERYFYGGFGIPGAEFGPPLPPQPRQSAAALATMNATLQQCGFYNQHWP